jgi:YD repeat-containing protein
VKKPRSSRATRFVSLIACAMAAALIALPAPAAAQSGQEIADAGGFKMNRDYVSELPFEHVDTLGGNLILTFTDLTLQGNAGRTLRITRTFNNKNERGGPKWTFGIAGAVMTIADTTGPIYGYPQLINNFAPRLFTADGAENPTVFLDTINWSSPLTVYNTSRWAVTAQFGRYDRYEHKLYMPDGTVCVYEVASTDTGPAFDNIHLRLVEMWDPYGNLVNLWYNAGGLAWVAQNFGGEVRGIGFDYDSGNPSPRHMYFDQKTWTYDYQPGFRAPLISGVTLPAGPGWTFDYNGLDEVTSVSTPTGGTVSYGYDNHQFAYLQNVLDQVVVTSRVLTTRTTGGRGVTPGPWTYAYTEDDGTRTSVTSPSGTVVRFYHDATGTSELADPWHVKTRIVEKGGVELERETRTYTSLPVGTGTATVSGIPVLLSAEILRAGQTYTTTHEFHSTHFADFHRPWRTTETGQLTRVTTRSYTYDFAALPGRAEPFILGQLENETVTVGGETFVRSWDYDSSTGFTTEATTYGITKTFVPDAQGNVASESHTHPGSVTHATNYGYTRGVLSSMTPPIASTAITRGINVNGTIAWEEQGTRRTSYAYDDLRRVIEVTPPDPNDEHTFTTYNPNGYQYRVQRGGTWQDVEVDGFGQVTYAENREDVTTETTYDAEGRVSAQTLPYDNDHPKQWTHNTYDGLGRLVEKKLADNKTITFTFTGIDVDVKDEQNRHTYQTRKAFGDPRDTRLTRLTDARSKNWTYSYNALGKLTRVQDHDLIPANDRSWTYNGQNLLTQERHPESGLTTYEYDAAGLLIAKTDAEGERLPYEYDANDRLSYIRRAAGGVVKHVGYDSGSDRVTQLSTATVSSTMSYDTVGRLSQRQDTIDGKTFSTDFDYDDVDNVDEITYPDRRVVKYGYDYANRVTSVKDITPGAVVERMYASGFKYHPSGLLKEYVAGNDIKTTVTQQLARQWADEIKVDLPDPPGTPAIDLWLKYHYDDVGNVTSIDDNGRGTTYNETLVYDQLDRMTEAHNHYGDALYAYDEHGNQSLQTGGRVFDAHMRLTQDPNGTYGYDNAGKLISSNATTFAYDKADMMTAVTLGSSVTNFDYDGDGWRVFKREPIIGGFLRTFYVHGLGNQLLSEFTQKNAQAVQPLRDYIYAGRYLVASAAVKSRVPTVAWQQAAQSVTEANTTAQVNLKLTLPSGVSMPTGGVTVTFQIDSSSAARSGGTYPDYTAPTSVQVNFPQTAVDGALLPVPIPILQDTRYEYDETIVLRLTAISLTGDPQLGLPQTTVLTIVNDDAAPVLNITATNSPVREDQGPATATVTMSAISERPVSFTWQTEGPKDYCGDYTDKTETLTFSDTETMKTLSVLLVNDDRAGEPNDEVTVRLLAGPQNATLGATSVATIVILDKEGAPFTLDATPGYYLADVRRRLTAAPEFLDYIKLANPSATAQTATITLAFEDGSTYRTTKLVPANAHEEMHLHSNQMVTCEPFVSAAVQSPAGVITAEHVGYWGSAGGRATEGVTPANTWYFSEGATRFAKETITAFNPNSYPVTVTLTFYTQYGFHSSTAAVTLPRMSRKTWDINALVHEMDHGTVVTASGGPIVVNRTMMSDPSMPLVGGWRTGEDGHSSSGVSTPGKTAYFAEGFAGSGIRTYFLLLSVSDVPTTLNVTLLHENNHPYPLTVELAPRQRHYFEPPPDIPPGGYGVLMTASENFVAERSEYTTSFASGSAGVGVRAGSGVRSFAEGVTSPTGFETWFLLVNPSATQTANVMLEFFNQLGTRTAFHTLVLPPSQRAEVPVNNLPGMSTGNQIFHTKISSSVPVVSERVTFWPRAGVSQSLASMLSSFDPAGSALLAGAPPPSTAVTTPNFDSLVTLTRVGPVWSSATNVSAPNSVWAAAVLPTRSGAHVSAGREVAATYTGAYVAFTAASSAATEGETMRPSITVTTATGAPLATDVTVTVTPSGGVGLNIAEPGTDFVSTPVTMTIPANTPSGTVLALTPGVASVQNTVEEHPEAVRLTITSATGAIPLSQNTHDVMLYDDDLATVSINSPQAVLENAGAVNFTVTMSKPSMYAVTVSWNTVNGSAVAGSDYTSTSGSWTFSPNEPLSKTVTVNIANDQVIEQLDEQFIVRLSNAINGYMGTADGVATIRDDDAPVPIDTAYPATYFPDLTASSGISSYILILNPHGVVVRARLTFTRPSGSGIAWEVDIPAYSRKTIDLSAEPFIAGQGDMSATVQSLTPSLPLVAEQSSYWDADWRGGRNSHGTVTPSYTWFFAEGSTGFFDEYMTVYNPTNGPVTLYMWIIPPSGVLQPYSFTIPTGPGRIKIRMNDYAAALEHGTSFAAYTASGAQAPVAIERTMYWGNGDRREGHSSNGAPTFASTWSFAEGSTDWLTYISVINPYAAPATVEVRYLHTNGVEYVQTATVPATGRFTLNPPTMPAGGYAVTVSSTNSIPIVAERSMYTPSWKAGDNEIGTPTQSTLWRFAEGATNSPSFSGYLLLANFSTTTANISLTFRLENGTTLTSTTTVPPRGRRTVTLASIPGLAAAPFGIEVWSSNGIPIVVERSMFWPSPWVGVHTSMGRPF